MNVRLECRTRAVKICTAALRHPWIHSPHCSVDGDLLWNCSKGCKKLHCLNVVFPSIVVEIRVLPVIAHLCWRSVPPLFEIWVSCCLEALVLPNSVLRQRSWLGPRKLRFVGVARRRLTALVQTVDGVFMKNPHERGCLRSSMLGLLARCCKRRRHLSVMSSGNKGVKLL